MIYRKKHWTVKLLFLISLFTFELNAEIFSQEAQNDLASQLSNYGTRSVDQIIADLQNQNNILDFIFSNRSVDNILSDISGDNELMQCVISGIDLPDLGLGDDILGGLSGLGGICKLFDLDSINIGGFDLGDLTKCTGTTLPNVDLDILKSFCGGNGSIDPSTQGGGVISNPTPENPNGWSLSTPIGDISTSIDLSGISNGTVGDQPKTVAERVYPSRLTGSVIYGQDGGMINKKASEDPNSATAHAVKTFDKSSLVLADLATKTVGSENPSSMHLPLTKKDVLDTEDEESNKISSATVNYHDLIDQLVTKLQNVFKSIEADTLAEYYKKEKEAFFAFISSEDSLKSIYTTSAEAIKAQYAHKIFIATSDSKYIDDPSEARASFITKSKRVDFRYAAFLQQYKNTQLKTQMALDIKRNKQLIDIAVRQAYVRASLFREDIAKKELDAMLQAVDTLIK